jgi:hypothetical protein
MLGAAIAAGFAVGVWDSFDDLKNINVAGRTEFKPTIGVEGRARARFERWEKAVRMRGGVVVALVLGGGVSGWETTRKRGRTRRESFEYRS